MTNTEIARFWFLAGEEFLSYVERQELELLARLRRDDLAARGA